MGQGQSGDSLRLLWGQRQESKSFLDTLVTSTQLPQKGSTPGAATDPAGFESQTLQACHLYLCPFPISRATASSSCLPTGENAKFGELT